MYRKPGPLFCLLALIVAPLLGESRHLTIVTDFLGPYSALSVESMKSELANVLAGSDLTIDWKSLPEARGGQFNDLVVVRFKGKCILEPIPYLYYDERGPLASTDSVNGSVLPFSEVACDRITSTVRKGLWGGDYAKADQLLGRALGRVVAHELVHIYTNSAGHSREGVAKEALSPQQLVSNHLELSEADLRRIREHKR
jgi:hypothetical protein